MPNKEAVKGSARKSWMGYIQRCTNPNHEWYHLYKDRFYEPWKDFETFLRDMGERPPGTTLDRIDNTKGYSPENCRWATSTVQQRNRETCVLTEEAAKTMLDMRDSGLQHKEIAALFDMSVWNIKNVFYRGSWTDVPNRWKKKKEGTLPDGLV